LILQLMLGAGLAIWLRMDRKPSKPDRGIGRTILNLGFDVFGCFHARPAVYGCSRKYHFCHMGVYFSSQGRVTANAKRGS
jgi:hypothetical protein